MTIDFKSLRQSLLDLGTVILPDILPAGQLLGGHWQCGDLYGGKGNSFKFNIETGKWRDFANPAHSGGDIIALYAMQKNIEMLDAAKELKEKYLGGDIPKYSYPVKPKKELQTIIKPPHTAEKPKIPSNCDYWEYRDEFGDLCFYIVKGIGDEGKKFFYPLCFTNKNEWIKKGWEGLKPLYNIQNITIEKPVLIVEGEKCADICIKFFSQYDVVTWAGGAGAWKHTDWSPLKDKKVLIWPDADEAGHLLTSQLGHHLRDICLQIKIIHTDKADGWDAYDAIVHEKWTFSKWALWAKPLLTVWDRPVEIQVLEPEEKAPEPVSISTDEFPIMPNMQRLFENLDLQVNGNGQVVMNASNVAKLLKNQMPNLVWRDTFYNANMTKWQTGSDRIWSDEDTNNLFIKMQIHYGLAKLTKNHVEDAINFVAAQDKRNEPQDWLNYLKWDGVKRVDDFFRDIMKAQGEEDYVKATSKNFWISLVARVLDPGCQVDEMVVLESKEGTFKTSALLAIAGKWYGKAGKDLKNKDFDQGLVGKILVDFSELSSLKNSDIEMVKDMITCREDQYRPSYGRRTEKFPRTCILAGTTNESDYLRSMTGNRRFNPLPVGKVDLAYIKMHREQLFAEAVVRFKAGESWWEFPESAEKVRESRRQVDAWESVIEDAVGRNPLNSIFMQTKDIWIQAFNGDIEKLDRTTQSRIGKIMRKIGYENVTTTLGGTSIRAWRKI